MRERARGLMLGLLALLLATPAAAQGGRALWAGLPRQSYAEIESSVVRIRTIAEVQAEQPTLAGGRPAPRFPNLTVYGTGVVIAEVPIEGQREYLILTNHHIADASNYVFYDGMARRENKHNTRELPEVPEQSHLVLSESDSVTPTDIRLEEVARSARGDFTLFRTVGATRELAVFRGAIGYQAGEIRPGTPVATSGFPRSASKRREMGRILKTSRLHALGQPHQDFTATFQVEHGQSGSPVFQVIEEPGRAPRYRLIGLLHAVEQGEVFLVPYELWADALSVVARFLPGRLPEP